MWNAKKYNWGVKFIFLCVQIIFLLIFAQNYNWSMGSMILTLSLSVLLAWAYAHYHIHDLGLKLIPTLKAMLALFAGSILTFSLQVELGFSAVLASSFVGILAFTVYRALKDENNIHIAAYCGSFIGMTNIARAEDYYTLIIASCLGACIYIFARNILNGVGGKLGSIAFVSICFTLYTLLG